MGLVLKGGDMRNSSQLIIGVHTRALPGLLGRAGSLSPGRRRARPEWARMAHRPPVVCSASKCRPRAKAFPKSPKKTPTPKPSEMHRRASDDLLLVAGKMERLEGAEEVQPPTQTPIALWTLNPQEQNSTKPSTLSLTRKP